MGIIIFIILPIFFILNLHKTNDFIFKENYNLICIISNLGQNINPTELYFILA